MTLEDAEPKQPVNPDNPVNPVENWAETAQKPLLPNQPSREFPICEEFGIPWTDLPHAQ